MQRIFSPPESTLTFFLHLLLSEEHASEVGLHRHLVARAVLREPVDEVLVALEELRVVQGQVGRGDGDAPLIGAAIRLAVAVDDLEEGRHGLGVVGDEDHLLSLLDIEADVVEEDRAVGIDRLEVFDHENRLPGSRSIRKMMPGYLRLEGRISSTLSFSSIFFARGGLLALGHVGRESADKLLQLLALLVGLHALVLLLAQGELARLVPKGVVAGEDRHLAKVDVDGLRAHGVEEVAVVADDEDGLILVDLAQVVLQPLHGLEVEVVGGLVEQQVVGLAEEGFGEHHAHLLVVAELARQLLVQALGDTQVLQQLGSLALSASQPFISANFSSRSAARLPSSSVISGLA